MTIKEFMNKVNLQYVGGINGETCIRRYVDNDMKVEKEIVTKRKGSFEYYPQKVFFFITGDKRTFRSVRTLFNAWIKKDLGGHK